MGMTTIEQSIELEVPVRAAYDQWTQFEDFPKFMEGVEEVRQLDDRHLHWMAEFGGSRHEWDAEITEQLPDERVAWRNTDGKDNAGVVTFHKIDDRPHARHGPDRLRARGHQGEARRRARRPRPPVKGDLERFKELVESQGGETGGWRGEVPREG